VACKFLARIDAGAKQDAQAHHAQPMGPAKKRSLLPLHPNGEHTASGQKKRSLLLFQPHGERSARRHGMLMGFVAS